ncbi:hypothetical protein [Candidatus Nitronereus thalassa]|uniref:Glycosyl transferase family 2 n=1 Tax=Candidatus Nitronereus thalassa TaxID=3020898 RepID=A0ABU3K5W2_9BACT|nr:hypothetical protein [Candidatus Nitronereus thalassa]MDT7041807.1 hypothetical protein [Candidatus Nitronereus thalassa]
MKVSGFTFIRNAIQYDFPIVEAITSVLPIVDEFVVNVGRSADDTLGLIRSIGSDKIRIVESVWDDSLRKDGRIFGIQQDVALSYCTGDWALLVQGDEVLHEEDYPTIRAAMRTHHKNPDVLGLVFRMVHFKGDYWTVDPWMYRKATRIVRNHRGIHSTTDCCDFLAPGKTRMLKSEKSSRLIKARMFHYGWVKDSTILREKLRFQYSKHDGERLSEEEMGVMAAIRAEFPNYDVLKDYRGTHPAVMQSRVQSGMRLRARRNRWLNPKFYQEVFQHGFRG